MIFSILIVDGCSPVGCVLTQLLKKWGSFITATSNIRSVPVIQALGNYFALDILLYYLHIHAKRTFALNFHCFH